ncbi:hypothetical protein BpHYR1_025480 [Brachionus plicatilis]|uniref:Uncharacterized protein n=1 Tax=Brachionus plicatilis TaxID=10195 RepID=A0A3M7PC13_BRAPC|nr:hypothetical protein BpHYR1_025480 [Brachionus plicatilis]
MLYMQCRFRKYEKIEKKFPQYIDKIDFQFRATIQYSLRPNLFQDYHFFNNYLEPFFISLISVIKEN